jgi:hypothetical protein
MGVVALQIGWFRTVFRCGASSRVRTLAERFSLDRSGSQIEKFIDFGSDDSFGLDTFVRRISAVTESKSNLVEQSKSGGNDKSLNEPMIGKSDLWEPQFLKARCSAK